MAYGLLSVRPPFTGDCRGTGTGTTIRKSAQRTMVGGCLGLIHGGPPGVVLARRLPVASPNNYTQGSTGYRPRREPVRNAKGPLRAGLGSNRTNEGGAWSYSATPQHRCQCRSDPMHLTSRSTYYGTPHCAGELQLIASTGHRYSSRQGAPNALHHPTLREPFPSTGAPLRATPVPAMHNSVQF